jgi:SAM-dependent methyltransferase
MQSREAALQEGQARLYPSLTNPNYLTLRARRINFATWMREIAGDQFSVLDVGGRIQPYRPLLNGRIRQYIGLDVQRTEFVDVIASGTALPFMPASFDIVIATQVFEYIAEAQWAAEQIWAVLKPGGVLLASMAALTPRVGDNEYWRFTPGGIRLLLKPFAHIEIVAEVSSLGGLARTVNQAFDTFVRHPSLRYVYRRTICPLINLKGMALEVMKLTSNDQFTTNYSVRAIKAI